jgi:hypothetical protein
MKKCGIRIKISDRETELAARKDTLSLHIRRFFAVTELK